MAAGRTADDDDVFLGHLASLPTAEANKSMQQFQLQWLRRGPVE